MTVYSQEKEYLKRLRDLVLSGREITQQDVLELLDKFEEATEMNAVTVKIIDRLMTNYDKLKQEVLGKNNNRDRVHRDILN